MIFPKKHIKLSESLFALGALILEQIDNPKTVEIWDSISQKHSIRIKQVVWGLRLMMDLINLDFILMLK